MTICESPDQSVSLKKFVSERSLIPEGICKICNKIGLQNSLGGFQFFERIIVVEGRTVSDLIIAHIPINAQSSNSVVIKLQPVYF